VQASLCYRKEPFSSERKTSQGGPDSEVDKSLNSLETSDENTNVALTPVAKRTLKPVWDYHAEVGLAGGEKHRESLVRDMELTFTGECYEMIVLTTIKYLFYQTYIY
jgi:hypothetical protein